MSPVSLTPVTSCITSVIDIIDTGNACIASVVDTIDAPVGPLAVANAFKGTISKKTSHQ
jgi:hypothetical protein